MTAFVKSSFNVAGKLSVIECLPLLLTRNRFLAFKGSEVSPGR